MVVWKSCVRIRGWVVDRDLATSIGRRSRFGKLFVMFVVTSVDLTFLSNSTFYEIFDVFRTFKPDAKIFQKI